MTHTFFRLILTFVFLSASLVLPQSAHAQDNQPHFVTIVGDQFVLNGQPLKLKGTNYYPRDHPWERMWLDWDGVEIDRELGMSAALGSNMIRILLPRQHVHGWADNQDNVDPVAVAHLHQLIQLAGDHNLRVLITLFDWYQTTTPAGSAQDQRDLAYIDAIVAPLANDDRVIAWDMHNEIDNYSYWNDPVARGPLLDWLGRMTARVRTLDRNHPITANAGLFPNAWTTNSNGVSLYNLSDFVSLHSYWYTDTEQNIADLQAKTTKPILLEETGYPTAPHCSDGTPTEQTQAENLRLVINEVINHHIGGFLVWQQNDLPPASSYVAETHDDHFGLLHIDYSWKPSAHYFHDNMPVEPLPASATQTAPRVIISVDIRPSQPSNPLACRNQPLIFPETGKRIRCGFRDYWEQHGGLAMFGYPLGNEFVWDGKIVQYFERARFEYNEKEFNRRGGYDYFYPPGGMVNYVMLGLLGVEMTAGRTFATAAPFVDSDSHRYFAATQHSLNYGFKSYWESHGGLAILGYPLSEEIREVNPTDGKIYTVQYFERGRFEYHPEFAGTPYEVELGQLGREYLVANQCS